MKRMTAGTTDGGNRVFERYTVVFFKDNDKVLV